MTAARAKADLPAGYWQEKGGRAAAAAAKAAAKAKELLWKRQQRRLATNRWSRQWAKHSDEQQSTANSVKPAL